MLIELIHCTSLLNIAEMGDLVHKQRKTNCEMAENANIIMLFSK